VSGVSHERLRHLLNRNLQKARDQSDNLFRIVADSAMYDRPIAERHRIVFYLGHLEAFDWNLVCGGSFKLPSFNAEFDRLFAFGIDPVGGALPADLPSDWPSIEQIRSYNTRVREAVDDCLSRTAFVNSEQAFTEKGEIFWAIIEHRLMHAETLAYMVHWLPFNSKHGHVGFSGPQPRPPTPRQVDIPPGEATLGLRAADSFPFGWDNEFQPLTVAVPGFSIDAYNVTNGQYLEFVRSGCYQHRPLWSEDAWRWITGAGIEHPKFWVRTQNGWLYRTMFEDIPLPLSWPVYVSHAEATAYAKWVAKSLPTEAQFHRSAFGSWGGSERLYPWGDSTPAIIGGNFDFRSWMPEPVGTGGPSSFGVFDLIGNGWEWTSTVFTPFPGFQRYPYYPGYSADFFDGKHFVMKGASPRTASLLVRPSFRNWFQPFYPNIYATFRCVEN
jgi:ergothioneine biosynthesis protein EgtB